MNFPFPSPSLAVMRSTKRATGKDLGYIQLYDNHAIEMPMDPFVSLGEMNRI